MRQPIAKGSRAGRARESKATSALNPDARNLVGSSAGGAPDRRGATISLGQLLLLQLFALVALGAWTGMRSAAVERSTLYDRASRKWVAQDWNVLTDDVGAVITMEIPASWGADYKPPKEVTARFEVIEADVKQRGEAFQAEVNAVRERLGLEDFVIKFAYFNPPTIYVTPTPAGEASSNQEEAAP